MANAKIKTISPSVISKKNGIAYTNITLSNGTVLTRTTVQFKEDLKASFLKERDVRNLFGGTVEGDFTFHKAGSTYKTTEFSKDVIAGNIEAGVSLKHEKDGYRVEGFLFLNPSTVALDRKENAIAYAELKMESDSFMESISNAVAGDDVKIITPETEKTPEGENLQIGATPEMEKAPEEEVF